MSTGKNILTMSALALYVGSEDRSLYAINPYGTLKCQSGEPGSKIGTQPQVGRRYSDTSGDHNALYRQRRQPDTGAYD